MTSVTSFTDHLACPICMNALSHNKKELKCNACDLVFPKTSEIHWLYNDPLAAIMDWTNRFDNYLKTIKQEEDSLKHTYDQKNLLKETSIRLQKMIQGRVEHRKSVTKILSPLNPSHEGLKEIHTAAGTPLPSSQSLMGYYSNVLRDWNWGNDENEICLERIIKSLDGDHKLGNMAVLGAGACRLPADLHLATNCENSIMVDINPLLFFVAQKVLNGQNVSLYEFPLAPINKDAFAVKLKCRAKQKIENNFHFLFSDAMNPSFKDKTLDTVVTPWLIDIVHQDIREFFRRINRILKEGGRWINFGSLAFFHSNQAINYSLEETLAIAEQSGFEITNWNQEPIPYLQSPYSCQARTETVLTFCAQKVKDIEQPTPFTYLPDWLTDPAQTIPPLPEVQQMIAVNQTFIALMSWVNGKHSIKDIAAKTCTALRMPENQAVQLITQMLTTIYEKNLKSTSFR